MNNPQEPNLSAKPPRSFSLKLNFSWTFAGNVVYALCQWGMLSVMAKLGNAQMVGQFALGLAITAPFYMFSNLQLRGILASDSQNQNSFNEYVGLRILASFIAFLLIVLTVFIAGYPLQTAIVIILIGIAKGAESVSDIIFGLLQKNERMDRVAISLMYKGIASLLLLGVLVWVTENIIFGVAGYALAFVGILAVYDLYSSRRYEKIQPTFSISSLWPLIRISAPMGVVMLLISLNTNIPRYFIESFMSIEQLGFFSAISYVMVAGTTVVGALGQSAVPRLSKYYAGNNKNDFVGLMKKLLIIGFLLGLGGVLIVLFMGENILTIMYRPEYGQYTNVFLLIMIGSGIGYVASFLGYAMTSARKYSIQPYIFLLVLLSSVLSCFWLVPRQGLIGAAWSLIISSVVNLLGSGFVNLKAIRELKNKQQPSKQSL
ncbi:lipopolysaccharide biosynthesis protein [Paenibacillus chitinolyticus]|uniref:lipopolysaccharide biosynthesis protein n=1 Tax=Paenibacillus chitinolyticus TaxID=79263 RepID=UPI0036DDF6EF